MSTSRDWFAIALFFLGMLTFGAVAVIAHRIVPDASLSLSGLIFLAPTSYIFFSKRKPWVERAILKIHSREDWDNIPEPTQKIIFLDTKDLFNKRFYCFLGGGFLVSLIIFFTTLPTSV